MCDHPLDRSPGAAPLYHQLAAVLKEKIESGEYTVGDAFPTELQLQNMYRVSRITVRNAVALLTNEGYLECARGVGTKVIFPKINEQLKQVVSFSEEMAQHGIVMSTKFCEISTVPASEQVAAQLHVQKGAPVFKLIRVRCADGTGFLRNRIHVEHDLMRQFVQFRLQLFHVGIVGDIHQRLGVGNQPTVFLQIRQVAQRLHRLEGDNEVCRAERD